MIEQAGEAATKQLRSAGTLDEIGERNHGATRPRKIAGARSATEPTIDLGPVVVVSAGNYSAAYCLFGVVSSLCYNGVGCGLSTPILSFPRTWFSCRAVAVDLDFLLSEALA